jgi:2-polyprenyl-3-methyl-5-hydroxy-6-metoxy-1,4-benzoquinol methylase
VPQLGKSRFTILQGSWRASSAHLVSMLKRIVINKLGVGSHVGLWQCVCSIIRNKGKKSGFKGNVPQVVLLRAMLVSLPDPVNVSGAGQHRTNKLGDSGDKNMVNQLSGSTGDAGKRPLPTIDDQREFWNWHWQNSEQRKVLNDWTWRRAEEILRLIEKLALQHPRILDLGCGHGWFTERLADVGEAHGIDLSPEGIAAAQARRPDIAYMAGNIYEAPLPKDYFDIVVSQEVIAHVEDQPQYIHRAAEVLREGGYLIITTGNKFVIDRLGDVGWVKQPPQHIRRELTRDDLRQLLSPHFTVLEFFTIIPHGKLGILRMLNSQKLNSLARVFMSQSKIDGVKEKMGFGWQMIFLAQKKK